MGVQGLYWLLLYVYVCVLGGGVCFPCVFKWWVIEEGGWVRGANEFLCCF